MGKTHYDMIEARLVRESVVLEEESEKVVQKPSYTIFRRSSHNQVGIESRLNILIPLLHFYHILIPLLHFYHRSLHIG